MQSDIPVHRYLLALPVAMAALPVGASPLSDPVLDVIDTDPDPRVFEARLSVDEQDVRFGDTVVRARIYRDLNNPRAYAGELARLPIPQIVVNLGDEVIVTLHNDLSPCGACNTSIHWHGVEVDNDSDGTGVTQNAVRPGESYTYRFRTSRPGVFWFHPHMKPGPQTFAGTYGAFIVRDPSETALVEAGRIPPPDSTHTIVLSDIEFDADGDVGYLDDQRHAVPWMVLMKACAAGDGYACRRMKDAATVLVNGESTGFAVPTIRAASGTGVRLRLINASTHRYFRLRVAGNGDDNNIYRIGGEGGLLEFVRLEGGVADGWDTKYDKGEIVIGSSARADVVVVPDGPQGGVVTIAGAGYRRGGPSDDNPAGELVRIVIDDSLTGDPLPIEEGSDILGAGAIENLKGVPITDSFLAPVPLQPGPGSGAGLTDETIILHVIGTGQHTIDGITGSFEDSGADYREVPFQGASRYASTGDTLELTLTQTTMQHHPFHLHGFSFQPVRVLDRLNDNRVLYEFAHNEFMDVIDVFPFQSVVIRLRLDDRPRISDNRQEDEAQAPGQYFVAGGARGRWLFHCHLFLHAALGMISELVVLVADRDGDGFDTSRDCDDRDPAINPLAEERDGDSVDNDCNGWVDDALPRQRFGRDFLPERRCQVPTAGGCIRDP